MDWDEILHALQYLLRLKIKNKRSCTVIHKSGLNQSCFVLRFASVIVTVQQKPETEPTVPSTEVHQPTPDLAIQAVTEVSVLGQVQSTKSRRPNDVILNL